MNRGFTLIELLAVVLIIAILGSVSIPVVGNILNDAKVKASKEQINFIEEQSKKWSVNHSTLINGEYYVSLNTLIMDGFIDNDRLIDPVTQEVLTGCVKISYDDNYNKYTYTYGIYDECK